MRAIKLKREGPVKTNAFSVVCRHSFKNASKLRIFEFFWISMYLTFTSNSSTLHTDKPLKAL